MITRISRHSKHSSIREKELSRETGDMVSLALKMLMSIILPSSTMKNFNKGLLNKKTKMKLICIEQK